MLNQRKRNAVAKRVPVIMDFRRSEANYRSNEEFSQSVSFLDKDNDIVTKKVETWKRTQSLNQKQPRFTTRITQLCIPPGICLKKGCVTFQFSIECAWRHVTHDAWLPQFTKTTPSNGVDSHGHFQVRVNLFVLKLNQNYFSLESRFWIYISKFHFSEWN